MVLGSNMIHAGLHSACAEIVSRTDGALGCTLVDLETGLPLAAETKPGAPLDATSMELLAAIGVSCFDSGGLTSEFGDEDVDVVQEIQTTTDDAYYFMARVAGTQELLILVTDTKNTNLGLGWMSVHDALKKLRHLSAGVAGEPGDGATTGDRWRRSPHQLGPTNDVFASRTRNRRSIWD